MLEGISVDVLGCPHGRQDRSDQVIELCPELVESTHGSLPARYRQRRSRRSLQSPSAELSGEGRSGGQSGKDRRAVSPDEVRLSAETPRGEPGRRRPRPRDPRQMRASVARDDRALPSRAGTHPAAVAALRASPPRPSMTRIAIEASIRCMPGPTWRTAIAWTWLSRRNRATRA
jgi:hypothetical protein